MKKQHAPSGRTRTPLNWAAEGPTGEARDTPQRLPHSANATCPATTPPEPDSSRSRPRDAEAEPELAASNRARARLLHTPEQAAGLLQVPASWLRKKAAAGLIPCTRVGRHLRFSTADVETVIRDGARPARHP
ncbi:helix-turn-helix domain-containing protein [Streptomyces sp. Ru87]|uniref:helix-turn-helix domain-containing protein n=1 Tax=Streptomyces sp. Ru87 TaxID=2044307 RepID=UPI000BF9A91D|nr:hypothetical protein CRI70_31825 [Streptomyces sp. Ru87]